MIYVNQKQLDQVEYIIEQSTRGHHVLFDTDVIRRVFRARAMLADETSSDDESENDEVTEKHIENLILQPTLISKRAYLENLTPDTFEKVVRTYFAIVENNIFEDMQFCQ